MEREIRIDNVEKKFGGITAVSGLSLQVSAGELFGLIGPDGAGKTTLIRMLVGLMRPDTGTLEVSGFDVVRELFQVKQVIGYLSQRFSLYPDLTVLENIRFYGGLFQIVRTQMRSREEELLAFSRLGPFTRRRAGALSGGMKQKLALCCTLIHIPRVLFLDEPTTGVDPVSRREFWDLLADLRGRGTTIFVSTAYMDEAARCDRVGLMYGGSLLMVDHPDRVPDKYPYRLLEVKLEEAVSHAPLVEKIPGVRSVQVFGDRLHVGVEQVDQGTRQIVDAITAGGEKPPAVREIRPGLEDVFVEMIR